MVFSNSRLPDNHDGKMAQLIRELFFAQSRDEAISVEGDGDDSGGEGVSGPWLRLQKEMLAHADGVLVVADTASMRPLMWNTADFVILDETSQLKEYQVVNAAARHLKKSKLQKIALFGDQTQLGPTVLGSKVNGFATMAGTGYMEIQVDRGQPYGQLTEQFWSHPHISSFISESFYNGQSTDYPSVLNCPWDATWLDLIKAILTV
ncbi:MAG: hypothetical protein Q9216_000654 [Gyalolechia sp. 2 TL-2023]